MTVSWSGKLRLMLSTLMEPDRPSSPGEHDPDDYFNLAEPENEAHVMWIREREWEIENKRI
jgi:hypothetical protein